GRYGRPVLKYSVIRPSGKALNYDPAKYKSAFERLAPVDGIEPKGSADLQWEYDSEAAAGDFEAARLMPQSALNVLEKMREQGAKRQRLEDEAQRVQKKLRVQSGAEEAEPRPTARAPVSSVGSFGGVVEFEMDNVDDSTIDAALELAPFEDPEDIALLASSRNAVAVPELQAKLASGAFDSDSESDSDKPASSTARNGSAAAAAAARFGEQLSEFDEEAAALARERERMSAIVLQLLAQEPSSFEADYNNSAPVDGSEKQKASQKSRDSKPSGSKGKGSGKADNSSSSDDSGSDSSSGESNGGSDDGSDQGSGKGSDDKASDDSSDSESDSDDDDSESDSDDESKSGDNDAMDVDDSNKPALTSLFGGGQQQQAVTGGGLFGGPSGGFKFTEALGLEADEPSAMIKDDDEEDSAPVTGGSRLTGPAERNLNANRLPAFFPDVDSPMFRRPEPVFQRQKTEEELEADLERTSKEMTKEYKAQLRSTVRKVQKLSDKRTQRRPN
ncbi:hypothetical protein LPJ71_009561, partial [Coemansia sp. S17]